MPVSTARGATRDGTVQYDARTQKQVTGFNLTGFGATTSTGTVPVVGEACMGNGGHEGLWSSAVLDSSSGGLFVNGVSLG